MMTKKHFEAIGRAIREVSAESHINGMLPHGLLVQRICDHMEEFNPQFDPQLFIDGCYSPEVAF